MVTRKRPNFFFFFVRRLCSCSKLKKRLYSLYVLIEDSCVDQQCVIICVLRHSLSFPIPFLGLFWWKVQGHQSADHCGTCMTPTSLLPDQALSPKTQFGTYLWLLTFRTFFFLKKSTKSEHNSYLPQYNHMSFASRDIPWL